MQCLKQTQVVDRKQQGIDKCWMNLMNITTGSVATIQGVGMSRRTGGAITLHPQQLGTF